MRASRTKSCLCRSSLVRLLVCHHRRLWAPSDVHLPTTTQPSPRFKGPLLKNASCRNTRAVMQREDSLLRPALTALVDARVLSRTDIFAREVPVIRNRVDVVCLRGRDSSLVGIELKVNDWSRVSEQAKRHGAWSHRIYVVIGSKSLPPKYLDTYEILQIGVVLAEHDSAQIVKRSPRRTPASHHLMHTIRAHVRQYGTPVAALL